LRLSGPVVGYATNAFHPKRLFQRSGCSLFNARETPEEAANVMRAHLDRKPRRREGRKRILAPIPPPSRALFRAPEIEAFIAAAREQPSQPECVEIVSLPLPLHEVGKLSGGKTVQRT